MMRLLISFLSLALIQCQPIDLKTGLLVDFTWLEAGYTKVSTNSWTTVRTTADEFKDPIVLVSIPEIGGLNYTSGTPTSIRLQDIVVENDGTVSFKAKMYLPVDAECDFDYSGVSFNDELVSWTVVEKGAYNLTGHYFFAFNGSVARSNSDLSDAANHYDIFYNRGCLVGDAGDVDGQCKFRNALVKEDIAYYSQIQSLNNDIYLLNRGKFNTLKKVVMVLSPHDSNTASYYNLLAEEVGVFAFEKGLTIACKEGLSFETGRETSITSSAFDVIFTITYKYPPGAYAMLNSLESLVDSTGLRVVDKSTTQASIITQEDKCADDETQHKTPETAGYLFVGASDVATELQCFVKYSDPDTVNCSTVIAYDLFGDGWGENVFLHVSTYGDFVAEGTGYDPTADVSFISTRDYNTSCTCTEITFCSQSGKYNVSVVTTEGTVVRHPWEIYWEYVDVHNTPWIGDIDSSIGLDNNVVVWYEDLVDYDYLSEENECDTCPHKPKPKPDKKGKKGDDKSSDSNSTDTGSDGSGDGKDDKDGKDGKPKTPPPAKVLIQLFDLDNDGDGWYDNVANWTDPCDGEAELLFPNVLSYPRYYISNDDRTKLIHSGSLCLHDEKEICEEVLPREGEFVYRVAGYDADGDESITWDFCGVKGTLGQELEFTMKAGICIPGSLVSASDYCAGIVTLASISGELLLNGVTTDKLSEYDTLLIEHMILSALDGSDLRITSWTVNKGVGLYVDFTITMQMEKFGYEGIYADMRSAFFDDIFGSISTASSQGFLMNFLNTQLSSASTMQRATLSEVTSIDIVKFEVVSVTYSTGQTVSNEEEVVAEPVEVTQSKKDIETLNYGYGAMLFAAVVVGGAFVIFTVSRVFRKKPYQALPDNSEHANARM